jgi:hypothetical protein
VTHVCSFSSGIDDMLRRHQADMRRVAEVLAREGRFGVFEATANPVIAKTMDRLARSGWFVFDHESSGFPWTLVTLTDKGREALAK